MRIVGTFWYPSGPDEKTKWWIERSVPQMGEKPIVITDKKSWEYFGAGVDVEPLFLLDDFSNFQQREFPIVKLFGYLRALETTGEPLLHLDYDIFLPKGIGGLVRVVSPNDFVYQCIDQPYEEYRYACTYAGIPETRGYCAGILNIPLEMTAEIREVIERYQRPGAPFWWNMAIEQLFIPRDVGPPVTFRNLTKEIPKTTPFGWNREIQARVRSGQWLPEFGVYHFQRDMMSKKDRGIINEYFKKNIELWNFIMEMRSQWEYL